MVFLIAFHTNLDLERKHLRACEEEDVDPLKAGAFLDCQGDAFWRRFQQAFRRGGPLSPETSSLAYGKWKDTRNITFNIF